MNTIIQNGKFQIQPYRPVKVFPPHPLPGKIVFRPTRPHLSLITLPRCRKNRTRSEAI